MIKVIITRYEMKPKSFGWNPIIPGNKSNRSSFYFASDRRDKCLNKTDYHPFNIFYEAWY